MSRTGGATIWVADTPRERYQGLSGTEMLPRDYGLLFVYGQDADTQTFVMRGMRYPIDIVFIDGTGTVTAVHSAVAEPGTAEGELTRYTGLGDDIGRKSRTHPPITEKL